VTIWRKGILTISYTIRGLV